MFLAEESSKTSALVDAQAISYPSVEDLKSITEKLREKSPLCTEQSILALRAKLVLAEDNKAFILHAGDCAERFSEVTSENITAKVTQLQELGVLISKNLNKEALLIGRIAGQYAKPRSLLTETIEDTTLPSYRGDLINGEIFNAHSRKTDPKRLLLAYSKASETNVAIEKALKEMRAPIAVFTSHEALNLHYEEALTRLNSQDQAFNHSTHLPWLGMRTASYNSIHLEYLSKLHNPIAVKLGPNTTPDLLKHLIERLNPQNDAGKLVLIPRLGLKFVKSLLPKLIQAAAGYKLCWLCDPMHGNTVKLSPGQKTRFLSELIDEVHISQDIHQSLNSHLAGLHLEVTPRPVIECLDSPSQLNSPITIKYESALDPRLNHQQVKKLLLKEAN